MSLTITVTIIIITVLVSLSAFSSRKVMDDLIFYPAIISEKGQFYRFVTYGFIHADMMHLLFNMYAFYLFGEFTEAAFGQLFAGIQGKVFYVLMYLLALILCVIPDYLKHRDHVRYRSLGASGAVSAVVFAYIMMNPMGGIGLIFIPIFIPGFLFGLLYLIASFFLGRSGTSRINHSAHLWGAVFGVIFVVVFTKFYSDYPILDHFIEQVKSFRINQLFQTY